MAQFTSQGGLKLLFFKSKSDRVSFGFEPKDPFHYSVGGGLRFMDTHPHPIQFHSHRNKLRFWGSSRIFISLGKKSDSLSAEERLDVGDGFEDDEDVRDELSSFKGLVLDISYRFHICCRYCSSRENLTIDHVLPIARGGEWKWENLVTACAGCNSIKGQKTLQEANMKLKKVPKAPKDYDLLAIPLTTAAIKMLRMRKGVPEEWRQYLSKPSSGP
ncbi:hypothetical protein HHK36_017532 [Tetracentron sinense]|uniref:HNH nuclease domain-containing protein n=1 Tax=Tetracentron sinense TaxID=13715 RepID=A0A834Z7D3_TETSI|nr:hypothetical protein HHK36_017532 [Tetracentron sinense]